MGIFEQADDFGRDTFEDVRLKKKKKSVLTPNHDSTRLILW